MGHERPRSAVGEVLWALLVSNSTGVNASWRCRHGFHRFVFSGMDNVRDVCAMSEPSLWVCQLIERCERCNLRRDRPTASVPHKVRIGREVEASNYGICYPVIDIARRALGLDE